MNEFHPMLVSLSAGIVSAIVFGIMNLTAGKGFRLTASTFTGIIVLLATQITLYFFMPSLQGSLFGLMPLVWTALVPTLVLFIVLNDGGAASHKSASIFIMVLVAVVIPFLQHAWNLWGPNNSQKYGQLAQVRVAGADETIPPTDPARIVAVTKDIAAFKGQTALTSTNQNLGSRYKVEPEHYVLQAVRGHRYWIAPLELANTNEAFFNPLFGTASETPGYVVVDAQNPDAKPILRLGFHITLFPDGNFGMNLFRQLYTAGWTHGNLEVAKFEVDEDWQPHWIVAFSRNQFGDVGGSMVEKVLVVDVATAAAKINAYDLGKQPSWIERVLPKNLVTGYADAWGYYQNDFAKQHPWQVWLGTSKIQSMVSTEIDINYTSDDQSVYVVPMTSINKTDHAVTGILVYDTNKNEAVYYPGLRGFNHAETVKETMAHAQVFVNKTNLAIDQLQIYQIYGELTWVAVITNPQSIGRGFNGVAMIHAMDQNASEVVYGPDMETALGLYRVQLARRSGNTATATRNSDVKGLSGKVLRVGLVPGNVQSPNIWAIMLVGDGRLFTVTRDTYGKAPLIKEGDTLTIKYLDISAPELSISTIVDEELDETGGKAK